MLYVLSVVVLWIRAGLAHGSLAVFDAYKCSNSIFCSGTILPKTQHSFGCYAKLGMFYSKSRIPPY